MAGINTGSKLFIEWDQRYSVGIPKIDDQHKELVRLTNELYDSCMESNEVMTAKFKSTLSALVRYVSEHFGAEERLLQRVNYPRYIDHKREHEDFVKKILEEVKLFNSGKSFVPNNFVRYLKDWTLSHIAVSDKAYSEYLFSLKKSGKI
ncbi:MAG: bacteriohemerythrin [Spirochaetaceae bacterium]|jgi:hemerythrin|nr:bacteriohemerythrin [Spirochaetaceae bacterium]